MYNIPTLTSRITEYENEDSMSHKITKNHLFIEENINNDSLDDIIKHRPEESSEYDDLQYTQCAAI
jgi:hypothetical protein